MAINLHVGQSRVYSDLFIKKVCRFSVVVCSRGWGKSYGAASCAVTAAYELIALPASVPNKKVYIIAPTFDQVVDIYWPILAYDFNLEAIAVSSSEALGRFKLPNNVELRLISYEAVQRLRGKGKCMPF